MSTAPPRPPQASNGSASLAPPHNLEAEQSVLGAILLSERSMYALVIDEGLKPEDFYRDRHRLIYGAMLELYDQSEPIDVLTVTEALKQAGQLEDVGGKAAIDSLAGAVPAAGNARRYAQIVRENALMRSLLTTTYEIQASVLNHQAAPRELVEWAERSILEVAHDDTKQDFRAIADVLHAELDKLQMLSQQGTALTGTPSGFKDLDEITGGFQPGNLIVIAARPSMGKSCLVTNMAENASIDHNKAVALFSLEMSEAELAQRFVASQARIKGDELRKGRVADQRWPKILQASQRLAQAPMWVDDSSDVGLLEIRAKARRLHSQAPGGLGLIIVDYLQLLKADGRIENRVEQIGQMSRGLKILARELSVPVVALSQLNRSVESRTDKRPILSDLRESGCLTGDSLVQLAGSGERRPIAELVGRSGFRVLALNPQTWKLEPRKVSNAFSTGRKPVYRLTTQLGRSVRATSNHKFLTIDGWRRLDELSAGGHVAVPRKLQGPATASMGLDELALLGHMIGDGCALPRQPVHYTTVDPDMAKHVAGLSVAVFGDAVCPRIARERTWHQVYLAATRHLTHGVRNPVAQWLDRLDLFGKRSHEKRVPADVFRQPDEAVAHFLRHLWATDGCVWMGVSPPRPVIYYASSSRGLAGDVQTLLLRFEINSRVRRVSQRGRGRDQFHVLVTGDDMDRFLTRVGTYGEQRSRSGRAIAAHLGVRPRNTNRDVIPRSVWSSIVRPAMTASGVSTRAMQAAIGSRYCGSTIYKSNLGRERARRVAQAVTAPSLERLAASDIYWDRIVKIEPAGEEEVYDLTVEGLHNFVADNVVVHNSIEQDADVVMFIYRDEYYDEDSERIGEADLILSKHRNGALGTVTLTFQKEYPKFMNYANDRFTA